MVLARLRNRALAAVLGFTACVEEVEEVKDPFIPVQRTERLQIGTSFEERLCRGEPEMWEAHLDEVEQTLGVTRGSAWVYVYGDEEMEQVGADCRRTGGLLGCWQDPVVRGIRMAIPHELVHAWLGGVGSDALPVLREGIAARMSGLVMVTADSLLPEESGPLTLAELVLDIPAGKYDEAGHLVSWLLATHGAEKFMALYARTSRGMSEAELSTVCLEILGQSAAELLLAYEMTSLDYYPALGGSACGRGRLVPWRDDGAAVWPTETSCADDPLFGFEGVEQWQRVTIEVPVEGWYLFDPAGREASVTWCLTEPADASELPKLSAWAVHGDWEHGAPLATIYIPHVVAINDEWAEHELKLTAGTYEVWVRRSDESPDETSELGLYPLDL